MRRCALAVPEEPNFGLEVVLEMSAESKTRVFTESSNRAAGHGGLERIVTTEASASAQAVRQIAVDRTVHPFDRRRQIADLIERELKTRGLICRTRHGRLLYFSNSERRLLDMHQRPFHHLLETLSGLAATETIFRFVLGRLRSAAERTPSVEVYTLSHYEPKSGLLVVSDGGRGVWMRERRGKWTRGFNGDDGLFFFTETESEPWDPEFSPSSDNLGWFKNQFLFSDYGRIWREDQASLYMMNVFHWFFPPLRSNRLIAGFLGAPGSGKTTGQRLTGCLLVGNRFQVSDVRSDHEDGFVAAITNRIVYAIDNVDTRVPWLENALARYATGAALHDQAPLLDK
jgi:hypothetical protein